MREHRDWQEKEAERLTLELVQEIAACLERPRIA